MRQPAKLAILAALVIFLGGCGIQSQGISDRILSDGTAALIQYESENTGVRYQGEVAVTEFDFEEGSYFGPVSPTLFVFNPETGKIIYLGTSDFVSTGLAINKPEDGGPFTLTAATLGESRSTVLDAIPGQIEAMTEQVRLNNETQQAIAKELVSFGQILANLAARWLNPISNLNNDAGDVNIPMDEIPGGGGN